MDGYATYQALATAMAVRDAQ